MYIRTQRALAVGVSVDEDERISIECYFNCHEGITYSNGGKNSNYPINSDLWWFGFDCGHCYDSNDYDLAIEYFPHLKEHLLKNSYPH